MLTERRKSAWDKITKVMPHLEDKATEAEKALEALRKMKVPGPPKKEDVKESNLGLWKYNKITGMWKYQRDLTDETKTKWLEIFKKDEPDEFFVASKNKPNKKPIQEDAPTVSAGAGAVAGIGIGSQGEPGSPKRSLIRRTKFAGHEVFEVDNDTYHKCKLGKAKHHRYEKYVGNDEVGEEIRKYGRGNPGKPIILKHTQTGAHQYLKYGKYT